MSKDQFVFNQSVRDELEKVPVELHTLLIKTIVASLSFGWVVKDCPDEEYLNAVVHAVVGMQKYMGMDLKIWKAIREIVSLIEEAQDTTLALLEVFQFFARAPLTVGEAQHITNFLKEYKVNG